MTSSVSSLYLATPCYGGVASALYASALLALTTACDARGLTLQIDLSGGEALIGRGRAATLAKFLASPASHLLFVDADIGFAPDDVFRLLDFDAEVAGGVYPRKQPPHEDELGLLPPAETRAREGFKTVAYVGAGFLKISREAARRMTDGYPELHANFADMPSAGVERAAMVFDSFTDPLSHRYLADHQAFCHRWRALGGEVWAHSTLRLTHLGASVEA